MHNLFIHRIWDQGDWRLFCHLVQESQLDTPTSQERISLGTLPYLDPKEIYLLRGTIQSLTIEKQIPMKLPLNISSPEQILLNLYHVCFWHILFFFQGGREKMRIFVGEMEDHA